MMSRANPPDPAQRSGMTRRQLLRRGAAVTAAGGVAAGTGWTAPRYSPVGRADAIAVTTGAAIFVGAAAGVYAADYLIDGNTDADPNEVLEDEIYNASVAVAQGREAFASEMQTQWGDAPQGESPFAASAWQAIRAEVVSAAVNGTAQADAQSSAQTALDTQATRSIVNMYERWNTGVNALIEELNLDAENAVGVSQFNGDAIPSGPHPATFEAESSLTGDLQTIEAAKHPDNSTYVAYSIGTQNLPGTVTDLEGREEDLRVLAPVHSSDNNPYLICPGVENVNYLNVDTGSVYQQANSTWEATHSSLSDQLVFEIGASYGQAIDQINAEHSSITSDLSDYVSAVYTQLEEGAMEPSDILSSQDIIDQFSDSDAQSRFAAEMLAIGADVPDTKTYEARVSHADLAADDLWGQLYLRFTNDPVAVKPGTTIASTDYDVAYLGFESKTSGEFTTRILSGSSDLQILEVRNLPDQQGVDPEITGDAADSNSDVVIYEGEDPPEQIEFPQDHSEWTVSIFGATNTSHHSPTEIVVDGNTYTIEGTGLNAGEAVESVELVPPTNYDSYVEPVTDATNPDDGETQARLENLREQVDDLEESGSGGGGLFPSIGLGGFGGIGALAVLGGLAAWLFSRSGD